MKSFLNVFVSPLGVLALFLLGILANMVLHVQGEGLWRLIALIPAVVLFLVWCKVPANKFK
jgi:hypothetical protein